MSHEALQKPTSREDASAPRAKIIKIVKYTTVIALFVFLLYSMLPSHSSQLPPSTKRPKAKYAYRTIPGYFQQSSPDTDFGSFNFTTCNFGLTFPPTPELDTSAHELSVDTSLLSSQNSAERPWPAFQAHVARLIANLTSAPAKSPRRKIKVLYITRHGQGVHNVAESQYGTHDWDAHWARLSGDGKLNWTDAALTAEGEAQANRAGSFWLSQVKDEGMQAPDGSYVSPLARCLDTAQRVYGKLYEKHGGFKPLVKENLRETMGVHTCDQRSSRTWIHAHYPEYPIEDSLTETDELWSSTHRETDAETDVRLGGLLDEIFDHDDRVWLGLTCHSGAGGALLRVLGHRLWRIRPGEIVPVFVEATELASG